MELNDTYICQLGGRKRSFVNMFLPLSPGFLLVARVAWGQGATLQILNGEMLDRSENLMFTCGFHGFLQRSFESLAESIELSTRMKFACVN